MDRGESGVASAEIGVALFFRGWIRFGMRNCRRSAETAARAAKQIVLPQDSSFNAESIAHGAQGGIVRAAAARRAGSASSVSRNTTADSASARADAAIRGDTNGPELRTW
jgi:hypothetical protein